MRLHGRLHAGARACHRIARMRSITSGADDGAVRRVCLPAAHWQARCDGRTTFKQGACSPQEGGVLIGSGGGSP
jgi:hypothetical protein